MIRKTLQYIDESNPVKTVELKDAVFVMAKAWDNVSQTTIQNCWSWRKSGLPGIVSDPTIDPFESDKEQEAEKEGAPESVLWERVVQQYPSMMHFTSLQL